VRSLIRLFTHNWKLKLAAFGLAMLLWVTVTADQVAVRWLPVPVEIEVLDPNFELREGPTPNEVQVRFSGPRREFWDLAVNRPQLRIVLRDVQAGTQSYSLEPQQVQIPRGRERGLNALDLRPGAVTLTFERVAAAQVPVRVPVTAGPAAEFALVDMPQAQPAQIRIAGPADLVAATGSVVTEPLDLSREDGAFEHTLAIDTTGLGPLELSTHQVRVAGRVERAIEQVVADVPVQSPNGVLVVPGAVDVQLSGAESVVRALTPAQIRVLVPQESIPARIPPGGISIMLRIDELPAGVRAAAEPVAVRVLAEPEPPPIPEIRTVPPAAPEEPAPDTVPPLEPP
jgi:hypothetical protein